MRLMFIYKSSLLDLEHYYKCCIHSCVFMNNDEHVHIKIYLSFYSWKGPTVCCLFEREIERHILKKGTSSCPISSSGSQGVPMLASPCKPYPQRRPGHLWSAAYLWLDSRFSGLCLKLTAWFSYHVVSFQLHTCSTGLPRHTAITLFPNPNVTACQSIWGH